MVLLIFLMISGAIAEVVSLAAIVPFLAILADPDQVLKSPLLGRIVEFLHLNGVQDMRLSLTVVFAIAALAAGTMRFFLSYAIAKINFGIGHEMGIEVYRRTLHQPYVVHVARNSSEIIGSLSKVDNVVYMFFSLLTVASSILMSIFIVGALLWIDARLASIALFGFGSIYVVVSILTRRQLRRNSQIMNESATARVQIVQEGLGGIRDILLDHSQGLFASRFNAMDLALRRAQASNAFIGPSPRYVVEALGMVLIASLGFRMTVAEGSVAAAIPALGALAMGAQRLMPLLQQIYNGWVTVAGIEAVLTDVAALLQQPVALDSEMQPEPMRFSHEIRLERVEFRYQTTLPVVLQDVSVVIPKGSRIGFIGTTGSGKSTAVDLLMGLLSPTGGAMLIDGVPLTDVARRSWQRNIAHVPQAIFLADASFSENIAFGVPAEEIDHERVRSAAQQAQIADFIEASSAGYDARVGERGVRLSGGQRQRIGIARALYKQARVLVFDEATSALDAETESAVMQAIQGLGRHLTVIVIAHRLGTLRECDVIYRLENGRIVSAGSYESVVGSTGNDETGPRPGY